MKVFVEFIEPKLFVFFEACFACPLKKCMQVIEEVHFCFVASPDSVAITCLCNILLM